MPEEQTTPTTEPATTEQAQPATPPAAPNADEQQRNNELAAAKAEADRAWKAYKGLQTTVNRLHQTLEERTGPKQSAQMQAQGEALDLLVKQTLGPEQAAALDERRKVAAERAAALQAAQSLEQSVQATVELTDRLMASAGLTEQDRHAIYAAARNTSNINEWSEAVHALAAQQIAARNAQHISSLEGQLKGKALAEAKAEAEAQLAAKVKELGIDKVDTSTGGTASTTKSVAEMSDQEFAAYSAQRKKEREQRAIQRLR